MALTPITPQSADRICVLLVGQAGTGKTSQLRCLLGEDYQGGEWVKTTMPPEKVLVLSAEAGLLCVRDLVADGSIQGFEIRSLEEFQEALRYCRSAEFKAAGFQWVFIDSLTEIAARCVEAFQAKYPDKGNSYNLWGEYNATMTEIVKKFRDMPFVSVCFTCLIAVDKDNVGRRVLSVDVPGARFKDRLPSYFDEILVMDEVQVDEQGTMEKVFNTRRPSGLAKDRSGRLSEQEYPNLLMIRDRILDIKR